MTKHDPKQAAATYTHACARCHVPVISTNPPDGQNTFCPACFEQNLGQVETWVLEDYCQFGAWARHKSAQIFLERYRSTPTVRERKFLALKIYEEFLLAAEDLELLYVALRDRAKRTVLESMLTVNLNDKTAAQWLDELRGPDDQVLERLGLMANGAVIGFSEGASARAATAVLHKAVSDMRAAAHHRTVEERVMVRAFNKLKHGFLAVARPEFVLPPNAPDEWVSIINLRRERGRFEFQLVEATPRKVEEFAGTIESAAWVAATVVFSYLTATGRRPTNVSFPPRP